MKPYLSSALANIGIMVEENSEKLNQASASVSSNDSTDVHALLKRIAKRDSAALSSLYDEFSGLLMSVILPVLKNKAEAEDILQDSFLTIWKKADMYQPHLGKPTSWMVTVAKNKAYDRYRKLARKSEGLQNFKESITNQPLSHQAENDNEALEGCFQKLNEDQQSAVGLVFYQGLTQQEASDQLEAPLGTVKARIRRGLIQLKQCLSNN